MGQNYETPKLFVSDFVLHNSVISVYLIIYLWSSDSFVICIDINLLLITRMLLFRDWINNDCGKKKELLV